MEFPALQSTISASKQAAASSTPSVLDAFDEVQSALGTNAEESSVKIAGDEIEVIGFDQSKTDTWDGYDFPMPLLRAIYAKGFENPSPIQQRAIRPIIEGRDVIAQAQSGTGKTATFSIGCLASINTSRPEVQALILANTHELAAQTFTVLKELGMYDENLRAQLMIGGKSVNDDIDAFNQDKPQVLGGTPDRIFDSMNRGIFDVANSKMIILDEADEMLTGTFTDQVRKIFSFLTEQAQVILFSATFPEEIKRITKQIMRDPVQITVHAANLTLDGIKQYFVRVDRDEQKYSTLVDIYQLLNIPQCMIFVNSVERAQKLTQDLRNEDFPVCCLHRDMGKGEREVSLEDFRRGKFRIMICTNITARGIDVQQVSLVVNYDVPKDRNFIATYLHRIGRSGRWGRKGTAINLVTYKDSSVLADIEAYYKTRIAPLPENPTL